MPPSYKKQPLTNGDALIIVAENERRQREALEEREKMLVRIEQNKRIEAEERARAKAKGRQYGADIVGQINYNQRTQMADRV